MVAPRAFFSFTSVPDPSQHRAYNEWHQLDHRPENLALDGVRHGERWVRTPRAAAASVADPRLASTHYVNLYLFRPPVVDAVREWQALAERSFQWGRRQDMAICTRPLMGFFDVVKAYVAPRVLVSADALPFRPSRGVIVQVLAFDDPHGVSTERFHHGYDTTLVPAMVAVDGVAGAYAFSSVSSTFDDGAAPADDARTFAPEAASRPGALRVLVTWCDDDVHQVHARVRDAVDAHDVSGAHAAAGATLLFDSALEVVEPWRWDWFDQR